MNLSLYNRFSTYKKKVESGNTLPITVKSIEWCDRFSKRRSEKKKEISFFTISQKYHLEFYNHI